MKHPCLNLDTQQNDYKVGKAPFFQLSTPNLKNKRMKRFFLGLVAMLFLWTACNTEPKPTAQDTKQADTPVAVVLSNFEAQAPNLVDKLISVKGTCLHTCKHGGGKMFISSGDSAAYRLKVIASDKTGKFNAEMEGNDYEVLGVVDEYRVDMAEIERLENEVRAEANEKVTHVADNTKKASCKEGKSEQETDDEHHAAKAQLKQLSNLRQKLKDSGKAYLSFFSVKAVEVRQVKHDEDKVQDDKRTPLK